MSQSGYVWDFSFLLGYRGLILYGLTVGAADDWV